MPKTINFGLLLATAASAGCLPTEKDDERGGYHDVTVDWSLKNLDGTVMTACPNGFTTLSLIGFEDPPNNYVDVPCTPQGNQTIGLATEGKLWISRDTGENYPFTPEKTITIKVTEETHTASAATGASWYIEKLASDVSMHFDIYPAGGVGVATWRLTAASTGAPIPSCASANVDQVDFAIRDYFDDTDPFVIVGTFPCDQIDPLYIYNPNGNSRLVDPDEYDLGSGHTRGLPLGEYYVELRAKKAGAIVGRSVSSLRIDFDGNQAQTIVGNDIVMADR